MEDSEVGRVPPEKVEDDLTRELAFYTQVTIKCIYCREF
jgi:hypothetical protein